MECYCFSSKTSIPQCTHVTLPTRVGTPTLLTKPLPPHLNNSVPALA